MAGGSQIIISSDGITIKTPKEFKVFAGQHIFSGPSVASLKSTHIQHLLPSDQLTPKAKITPNIHFPITGVLARIERLDGKKINSTDKLVINGTPLKEVWISENGVAYFIPPKNIPQVKSIEINGESLNLEKNLRQFHTNKEGIDSISEQVEILNEALGEHKKQFSSENKSDVIVMQGVFRYSLILDYIDQLDWDYESQKYLLSKRLNLKVDF
ncbi:DUF2345 domain-containing protein [Acinetobacter baumannii]|nr:DUF2345 domain-containing protein [Acinetobacter baumannii]